MQEINPLYIAGIVGVISTITMFWNYFKTLLQYISSLLIVKISIDSGYMTHAINCYFLNNMKISNFGVRSFLALNTYLSKTLSYQIVGYEKLASTKVVWSGLKPIFINTYKKSGDRGIDGNSSPEIEISFLRGTFQADLIIKAATDYYNKIKQEEDEINEINCRYEVVHIMGFSNKKDNNQTPQINRGGQEHLFYKPVGYTRGDIASVAESSLFQRLTYPQEVHDFIKEIKFWKNSKDWYLKRGIPWKRGCLVYGKPGTGKTSLAKSLARDLNIPIYVFNLASLTNFEFQEGWKNVTVSTPCMVLMEDIDKVFSGGKNIFAGNKTDSLSFATLLNAIDGVEDSDGIVTIVTTNNIREVDSALGGTFEGSQLGARPGRIDSILELREITQEGCLKLCKKIIPEYEEIWEKLTVESLKNNETPAQFQDRCKKHALTEHFKNLGV